MKAFGVLLLLTACTAASVTEEDGGTEIPWAHTLEEALEKARKESKPVCWVIPTVARSPMGRTDLIEDDLKAGPFLMPGVVRLMRERFVPLWREADDAERERFGLEAPDFIEPAFLFLSPEGEVLRRMHGLTTWHEGWLVRQMARVAGTDGVPAGPAPSAGEAALKAGRFAEAETLLREEKGARSRYLHGCALFLTARETEADEIWKGLAKEDSLWGRKADQERRRRGPFTRGMEMLVDLPENILAAEAESTKFPRQAADRNALLERGVRYLLSRQRSDGGWTDSRYDYAGEDAMPDVHLAITALSAWALLLHREVDPAAVDRALDAADRFLAARRGISEENDRERSWALMFESFYRLRKNPDPAALQARIRELENMQLPIGHWYHEYANPFVTAMVMEILIRAREAGAEVGKGPLRKGAEAVKRCRESDGTFGYYWRRVGATQAASAGRMPICELALFRMGLSDGPSLEKAVETYFRFLPRIERVRKFDNHADEDGLGGFFYFHDLLSVSLTADALEEKTRSGIHARLEKVVLEIAEIDGTWIDSHELGRSYGTACALVVLGRGVRDER